MSERRNSHIEVKVSDGTLGELRAALASVEDLSDETRVHVRTAISMNPLGGHPTILNLIVPEKKEG